MKIISVVGARPNFIKIAPIHKAFLKFKDKVEHKICHTGQHFDEKMSKVFFEELEMPRPDFYLGIGGGSHASQTARIMLAFEEVLEKEKPDLIIVPGDVNSTMACSLVASKLGIKIAHVEAGLRSHDREMPEEINRIVTDVLSDYLFVSERSGLENLKKEGVSDDKVFFTGNVMIDSLVYYLPKIDASEILKNTGLQKNNYILVTFHRPSNVDNKASLKKLVGFINAISEHKKVVFPVHPRTLSNMKNFNLHDNISDNVHLSDPIGYIDFLSLVKNAMMVITDSGGIQEETTWLGIPCITVRNNTERPSTVDVGTNILAGIDFTLVEKIALKILSGNFKKGSIPELWDGNVASRIVTHLLSQT